MSNNYQVLLLNTNDEVLGTMPRHQAMRKLMRNDSVLNVVEWGEGVMTTFSGDYPVPSVVRLSYYLSINWKRILRKRKDGKVSRIAIFRRDEFQCQYCSKKGTAKDLTLDHIMPKSKGGSQSAQNLVTACIKCNGRKANRTPEQARMPLITPLRPLDPTIRNMDFSKYVDDNPSWRKYINKGEFKDEKIEVTRHQPAAIRGRKGNGIYSVTPGFNPLPQQNRLEIR